MAALIYPGNKNQVDRSKINGTSTAIPGRSTTLGLSTTDPAFQYQTQKVIQNTVMVPSSLYSMNLGALSTYQAPSRVLNIGVNWNQMSDRALPHSQTGSGYSQGSSYHGSSTRHTQTRDRPGAMTPGGSGVDIKHNSYYRYMNRLKAKKDLRRGRIPKTFGLPIPFSPAAPVYGGKTVKTSIVSGCACAGKYDPLIYTQYTNKQKQVLKKTTLKVGDLVYARLSIYTPYLKATIVKIPAPDGSLITVKFETGGTVVTLPSTQVLPYFSCDCESSLNPALEALGTNMPDFPVIGITVADIVVEQCSLTKGNKAYNLSQITALSPLY
jgi:hypothetical protein